jgi:hypothetical protein
MSDRRRFLKGLTSPWGRERPIRRPAALSRHIALRQAGIGQRTVVSSGRGHTGPTLKSRCSCYRIVW